MISGLLFRLALLAFVGTSLGMTGVLAKAHGGEADRPPPAMKGRVFEIKHRETGELVDALRSLLSGVKGCTIDRVESLHTITVRDFPENLAIIDQTLRRLDTASAPAPNVQIQFRVLLGANVGTGQVPADLETVVKQLQASLSFKSYSEIANLTQRVRLGVGLEGRGTSQVNPPLSDAPGVMEYRYNIDNVNLTAPASGGQPVVQLRRLRFKVEGKHLGDAEVVTGVSLREGEKVVVGTGSLKDRAMVVVLSVKILR